MIDAAQKTILEVEECVRVEAALAEPLKDQVDLPQTVGPDELFSSRVPKKKVRVIEVEMAEIDLSARTLAGLPECDFPEASDLEKEVRYLVRLRVENGKPIRLQEELPGRLSISRTIA